MPFSIMQDRLPILKWATDCLTSQSYALQRPPEIVVKTPWSTVIRFSSSKGNVYLKQTPPAISLEPKIIQLLRDQFQASVPMVIALNDDLHCFLMEDGRQTLRAYLKTDFQTDLLLQAVDQHTTIQRSVENHIESFLTLGVPDWRLEKLPKLYDQLIQQTDFLKAEGLMDKELQILHDLSPTISKQCEHLSQYRIPETFVQPDFHTNNVLFDPDTQKMTFIDWGEIVISHPFFALHNFLLQAITHHGIKESDQIYQQLQDACCENWLECGMHNQLLKVFQLIKKLFPIYSALAYHRLMISVDLQALQSFYAHRPNRLAGYFREYITFINEPLS